MATKGGGEGDLSHSQLNAGDETFDHLCTRCHKKNKNKAALKYCGICLEYMCTDCVDNHNSFTALSKHVLVDVSQVQVSGNVKGVLSVPTEMCKDHPMKVVDMYCENHDVVGCSVCIAPHYKSCTDIHYIPEYVKIKGNRLPNKHTIVDISTCINDLDAFKKLQNNLKRDLANKKSACRNAIKKFRAEINKAVDKLEETSLKELDEAYRKLEEEISNQVKKIETIETELAKLRTELETTHDNESQQYAVIKVSQGIVMKSVKLTSSQQMVGNVDFHFDRNTDILDHLQQFESLQMGSLLKDHAANHTSHSQTKFKSSATHNATELSNSDCQSEAIEQSDTEDSKMEIHPATNVVPGAVSANKVAETSVNITHKRTSDTNRRFYNVKNRSEYNIKSPNDKKTCDVQSVCILDNGSILLADYNNKALKVLDKDTYIISDYLTLKYYPKRICRVNNEEVAVSLGANMIRFITSKPKLSVKRGFNMKHFCYGLVAVEDKLYVCDDKTSVHIYTLCGEHISAVQYRSIPHSYKNRIYNDITFNNDSKLVYICDPVGLTAIDLEGNVIWQHQDSDKTQIEGPTDVCCDDRGTLFVSGFTTNNVVLQNQNGEFMEEIISSSDFMQPPNAICLNEAEKKLIATMFCCDKMFVFSLQRI